jgi:hypothetical protein
MFYLAELFGGDITHEGVLTVMIVVTAIILLAVGITIWLFAKWSAKEKRRRNGEIRTAREFGDFSE